MKQYVNRWNGWAQVGAGQHFHFFVGRKALCGLTPRAKQRLFNPQTTRGWSEADCPDCHSVLKNPNNQEAA